MCENKRDVFQILDPLPKQEGLVVDDNKFEKHDNVVHPRHYTSNPSGVECWDVAQHFNFNIGNAMKYLWRCGEKHPDPREDLRKSRQYIDHELERLDKLHG